jgi:hypothetical protein
MRSALSPFRSTEIAAQQQRAAGLDAGRARTARWDAGHGRRHDLAPRIKPRLTGIVMKPTILTLLAVCLALAGCASTVKKSEQSAPTPIGAEAGKSIVLDITGSTTATTARDWSDFKSLWREPCAQEASAVGAVFSMKGGDPILTGNAGTLVVVDVAHYRYVSTGARIAFGLMTGNAFINAQVTFRDLKNGAVRATKTYDTTSTAWQGVFSGMTTKQVRAMCHEIVGEIAG